MGTVLRNRQILSLAFEQPLGAYENATKTISPRYESMAHLMQVMFLQSQWMKRPTAGKNLETQIFSINAEIRIPHCHLDNGGYVWTSDNQRLLARRDDL
jgi:hypothetical protein